MSAQIFLSCGQSTEFERTTAQQLKVALSKVGFTNVYIATEKHSLRAIVENIYERLKVSEYFLFINFRRDVALWSRLFPSRATFPVSLFSHQELAIASYLGIPTLIFQQQHIDHTEGILNYIQGNPITFSDYVDLESKVLKAICDDGWNPNHRRALLATYSDVDTSDAIERSSGFLLRFFHVRVSNLHDKIIARDASVYLEKYSDLKTGKENKVGKVAELKWAGTNLLSIAIRHDYPRLFDAVIVGDGIPGEAIIPMQTDASDYQIKLKVGKYRLDYVVLSDAFEPARISLELDLKSKAADTSIKSV